MNQRAAASSNLPESSPVHAEPMRAVRVLLAARDAADAEAVTRAARDVQLCPIVIDDVGTTPQLLEVARRIEHDVYIISDGFGGLSSATLLAEIREAELNPPVIFLTRDPTASLDHASNKFVACLGVQQLDCRGLECLVRFLVEHSRLRRQLLSRAALLEREVAERARAEQELERSNKELEQFAYAASHDLQEPLRMVSGYLRLLEHKLGASLNDESRTFLDYAVDGSKRMSQLIEDLLEYSRVTTRANPPIPTDCKAIVTEALANLAAAIDESGAEIKVADMPTLPADGAQLKRLFQNLIGNSIKFARNRKPMIKVDAERCGKAWRFSITDNGIGIDPRFSQRVFGIFQRLHTRDEYPGTGIGLALCRRIVEHHGGEIWVEAADGGGSTFRFTIPIRSVGPDEEHAPDQSSRQTVPASHGESAAPAPDRSAA